MSGVVAQGIKAIIDEKGLRQKYVAEKSNFTEQQFSDMVNDRKVIKAVDLIPISKALGVAVQDIYDAGARVAVQQGQQGA